MEHMIKYIMPSIISSRHFWQLFFMNEKSSTMMTRPTGTSAVSSFKFSCCNTTDVIVKMLLNVCPTKSLEALFLLYCVHSLVTDLFCFSISVELCLPSLQCKSHDSFLATKFYIYTEESHSPFRNYFYYI